MKTNLKNIFLIVAALLVLSACGGGLKVNESMRQAMVTYADSYEQAYPSETESTARVCASSPSGVYWSDELQGYIVTCKMPTTPTAWGIVFMNDFAVSSTCGIDANSQGELVKILHGLGYR